MAGGSVRGGLLALKIDGKTYSGIGNFTYNLGKRLRTTLIGSTGVDGFSETPQAAFIEGEVRDAQDLSLSDLVGTENVTASLELANGKTFILSAAWYEGEGTANSAEGNFPLRLVSAQEGQEV